MILSKPERSIQGKQSVIRCVFTEIIEVILILSIMVFCWAGNLEASQQLPIDLTELGLEELMNITVTSVAKKEQKLFNAPAAIFVISQEDIRRSGAMSIPEVLRMVPGLQVARIDANKWAISSRGFNGRFASKLLVLIDSRSVYTPFYSGVYWDVQDVLLEDLDRIEVIRGPGAALWGANAVNGVINIITKKAKDTQGSVVSIGLGTEERGFGGGRYGGKRGDNLYYRIFTKYFRRDGSVNPSGVDTSDDWDVLRGGFRVDWILSNRNTLTLQGDIYDGEAIEVGQVTSLSVPPYTWISYEDTDIAGGNILAHWQHTFSDSSDIALQLYYDRTKRTNHILGDVHDTFDMDFQHRFLLHEWHEVIWGLEYRFIHDNIDNSFTVSIEPNKRNDDLCSAFVQDDITLVEERLYMMLGSKFEHNDYTGFEIQPNARMLWTPHANHSAWVAVSRAVRTPNRSEDDIRVNSQVLPPGSFPPFPGPGVISFLGTHNFDSEELLAYEFGYRTQPMNRLSLDMTVFYNVYDKLRTLEAQTPFFEILDGQLCYIVPLASDNKMSAETYGVELVADWQAMDWWRFQAAYTYLQIQLHLDGDSTDVVSASGEGENPHHQVSIRSSINLWEDLEFDFWLRYIDELPSQNVESYVSLDIRVGWNPSKNIELSIVGQNLFDSHHPEFIQELYTTIVTEIERSVYGKITWRF
ncbi:MAG: TonB-dependent receptor [Thermodesulfobacteriota bacterium]|nr:TonB-dependent receptor [Thermodesulfobacteriota bacterium]